MWSLQAEVALALFHFFHRCEITLLVDHHCSSFLFITSLSSLLLFILKELNVSSPLANSRALKNVLEWLMCGPPVAQNICGGSDI